MDQFIACDAPDGKDSFSTVPDLPFHNLPFICRRHRLPPVLRQEVQLPRPHHERRGHAQAAGHVHHQGAGGEGGQQGRLPEVPWKGESTTV